MQLVQWGLSGSFPAQCSQVREVEAGKENLPCKPERVAVSPATSSTTGRMEICSGCIQLCTSTGWMGWGSPGPFTQN